ncbi:hypothetical protein G7081_03980 [Vagococcus coleopterorum]|uniref:Uncharacterized protein n=1 Tax=Vagococcus coleopterorum TaxID=2714946 RepID=A0A6G8AMR3_9ENTE|nr:cell division site-positioning protein MapZ family protein [Vagococcus coleopterorum]QIL46286.1 hypothetical protein G7081_03980 [Vagococcus coleopterorum]
MAKEIKCPNCGRVVTTTDGVCPNCDSFSADNKKIRKPASKVAGATAGVVAGSKAAEVEAKAAAAKAAKEAKAEVEKATKESAETVEETIQEKADDKLEKFAPAAAAVAAAKSAKAEASEEVAVDVEQKEEVKEKTKEETKEEVQKVEEAQVSIEEASDTDNTDSKKGSKGKKVATGLAALLLLGGGGYGYSKYQETTGGQSKTEMTQHADLAETHLNELYLNESKVFLSEDFNAEKLEKVVDEVAELKNKDLKADLEEQLTAVQAKAEKQFEVNNLFKEGIIKGDKLSEKPVFKTSLNKVPVTIEDPKDDFETLVNQGLTVAKKQLTEINEAKDALANLLDKDSKPKKDVTRKQYDEAKKLVDQLTDKDLKAKFEKDLATVDKVLSETEKAAKEKAASEQTQTQQQGQQSANGGNAGTAGSGGLDHGANSDGGGMVKDGVVIHGRTPGSTLDGDWSWAPGVQENFINTVISRGYVTPGGYTLVAKEILNGEAYYELYATRRDTAITQSFSDSQLPIYIVTVNAKTGSFRGGAPNYSDANKYK